MNLFRVIATTIAATSLVNASSADHCRCQCDSGSIVELYIDGTVTTPTTPTSTSTTPTTPTSTSTTPTTFTNIYHDATVYVNPDYAEKIVDMPSHIIPYSEFVKSVPTFVWIDKNAVVQEIPRHLSNAANQAANGKDIVAQFVVYNLPARDCHAFASNGELMQGDLAGYKKYIDNIVAAFSSKKSNVRLSLVIEPDSLPNLATNMDDIRCANAADGYKQGTAYAIAKLSSLPKTVLYLDCAHGGWLGWKEKPGQVAPIFKEVLDMAKRINSSAKIEGFATSVSNYSPFKSNVSPAKKHQLVNGMYDWNPAIDEERYIVQLTETFKNYGLPTRYLVDTSRSGKSGIRQDWGSWCNIKGAGIGELPTVDPHYLVDAFVWVKPPGESDGVSSGTYRLDIYCDPTKPQGLDSLSGAPQAGQWFRDQFIMLVENANPKLPTYSGSTTTSTTSTSSTSTSSTSTSSTTTAYTSSMPVQKCIPLWGDCTGNKTCCTGSKCVEQNQWYAQCLVDDKPPPSPTAAVTTRYHDCCRPSCSWPDKLGTGQRVRTCKIDGMTDAGIWDQSGCNGGAAYACNDQQPWAMNDTLSYGFAAAAFSGKSEKDYCCRCYELTFPNSKKMIVQITNTGSDLGGAHFDIQMAGGGVGIFDGCTKQWGIIPPGNRYGGVTSREQCDNLPLGVRNGCYWRFDWFENMDNPDVEFKTVRCPKELTDITGCVVA